MAPWTTRTPPTHPAAGRIFTCSPLLAFAPAERIGYDAFWHVFIAGR